jgi:hypothetical protein
MDHVYSVTGTVIKGHCREYEVIILAKNQKDAKEIAKELWGDSEKKIGHLFHLSAKRTWKPATIHNSNWHKISERMPDGHWVDYD